MATRAWSPAEAFEEGYTLVEGGEASDTSRVVHPLVAEAGVQFQAAQVPTVGRIVQYKHGSQWWAAIIVYAPLPKRL